MAKSWSIASLQISRRTAVAAGAAGLIGALPLPVLAASRSPQLTELASSDRSWVQVAVSPEGRIFVNYSRWFGPLDCAVAEIDRATGVLRPYPNVAFSSGDASLPASERAVSVQSVVLDPSGNSLWIVDSGNPQLAGLVLGGAKLVEVDLATDEVVRALVLAPDVAPPGSYLADVRIDPVRNLAFLPDLALGAIAVVDLGTGRGRRVLEGHITTRPEDIALTISGRPWLYPDGSRPQTACTSIALRPDRQILYFKALVGGTLYQVPVETLVDPALDAASAVRPAVSAHPSDAIAFGPDGWLYLTAIDRQAITRWQPWMNKVEMVVEDPRLAWPVGLTFDRQGCAYTTVGRIHEGSNPSDLYRLYRIDLGFA